MNPGIIETQENTTTTFSSTKSTNSSVDTSNSTASEKLYGKKNVISHHVSVKNTHYKTIIFFLEI